MVLISINIGVVKSDLLIRANPAFGAELLTEFADNGFVLRGVAEENTEFAVCGKDTGC